MAKVKFVSSFGEETESLSHAMTWNEDGFDVSVIYGGYYIADLIFCGKVKSEDCIPDGGEYGVVVQVGNDYYINLPVGEEDL